MTGKENRAGGENDLGKRPVRTRLGHHQKGGWEVYPERMMWVTGIQK